MTPRIGRRAALLGAVLAVSSIGRPDGAAAACALDRRRLRYAMRVGGAHIADLELRLECAGSFALLELTIANRGLAAWLAGRNRTAMTALVAFDGNDEPRPASFRASYQKPDRLRETELDFAPDGRLTHLVTRNQGRHQESPVPEELRQPSIDPLATLLELSHWLSLRPEPGSRVTYPVFEGRKRADLVIVYRGQATIEVAGQSRAAHYMEAALEGLAGFDESDGFVTLPGEPLEWIGVYASLEPTPVPLLISNSKSRLAPRIELVSG